MLVVVGFFCVFDVKEDGIMIKHCTACHHAAKVHGSVFSLAQVLYHYLYMM